MRLDCSQRAPDSHAMRLIFLAACLACSSCGTHLYGPNGQKRLTTTANLTAKKLTIGDFSATNLTLDHATPFKAIGDIITQAMTFLGVGTFLR